jgi:hypothetical protein
VVRMETIPGSRNCRAGQDRASQLDMRMVQQSARTLCTH